jgi:hypothetical protein
MIGTSRACKKEDRLSQGGGPKRGGERDGTGVKKIIRKSKYSLAEHSEPEESFSS